MDKINYDYYRIFYYVAKYKSITLAAKIINGNQPNISKFMNKLEKQLGCKLMYRSNLGITLTPEGEQLYKHVAIAYEQLKTAEEEISDIGSMQSGSIHISTTETALHGILMEALVSFRHRFPKIRLFITNETTPEAIQSLKKGLADFAVVTSPYDHSIAFNATKLMNFKEVLLAPKDSFAASKRIEIEQISSLPLIGLSQRSKTHDYYTQLFLNYGLQWRTDIEVATTDQILPMIKAGLGIGFLPEFMAYEDLEKGNICEIKINDLNINRQIVLLEDNRQKLSSAAKRLKALLFENAKLNSHEV